MHCESAITLRLRVYQNNKALKRKGILKSFISRLRVYQNNKALKLSIQYDD